MMDPKEMKKKALMSMIKDGMGIKVQIKKGPAEEVMADEGQEEMEEGFEQMMVSPEEKEMILSMRKKSGMEDSEEVSMQKEI